MVIILVGGGGGGVFGGENIFSSVLGFGLPFD